VEYRERIEWNRDERGEWKGGCGVVVLSLVFWELSILCFLMKNT